MAPGLSLPPFPYPGSVSSGQGKPHSFIHSFSNEFIKLELPFLCLNSFLFSTIYLQAPEDLPPKYIPISPLHSFVPATILTQATNTSMSVVMDQHDCDSDGDDDGAVSMASMPLSTLSSCPPI